MKFNRSPQSVAMFSWALQVVLVFCLGFLSFCGVVTLDSCISQVGKYIVLAYLTIFSLLMLASIVRANKDLFVRKTAVNAQQDNQFTMRPNFSGFIVLLLVVTTIFMGVVFSGVTQVFFNPMYGDVIILIGVFIVIGAPLYLSLCVIGVIIANMLDEARLKTEATGEADFAFKPNWIFLRIIAVPFLLMLMFMVVHTIWVVPEAIVYTFAVPKDKATLALSKELDYYHSYKLDKQRILDLLDKGADINVYSDYSPVSLAAHVGDQALLRKLLAMGANPDGVDVKSGGGNPALVEAIPHTDMMLLLIRHGANVNYRRKVTGETALMRAARDDMPAAVRLLIDNGANVNIQSEYGDTALAYAASKPNPEVFNMILRSGAIIPNSDVYNVLTEAARSGDLERVERLVSLGAKINPSGKSYPSGLLQAA